MTARHKHQPFHTASASKIIASIVLMFIVILPVMEAQEWLKYEVAVEALIIPLFAMDKKGDPVLDLKKEEITLLVDGKPVDISYFKSFKYTLKESGAELVPVKKNNRVRRAASPPERVIFIAVDTTFNSAAGIMRSKAIAGELIKKAPPTDRFILLEFSPNYGLHYRGGPNIKRETLLAELDKITPLKSMWTDMRNITASFVNGGNTEEEFEAKFLNYSFKPYNKIPDNLGADLKPMGMEAELEPTQVESGMNAGLYKSIMLRFTHSLRQLKYALKTITKPKLVFMFSEGMMQRAMQEGSITKFKKGSVFAKNNFMQGYLMDYMKQVVHAINEGGSLLYTINPSIDKSRPDADMSGEMSLKYMAGESGGKYFTGRDTKKVIQHIRNTTTAYYEVAFHIPRKLKEQFDIKFKTKRKGITLHSLNRSERTRTYKDMGPVQKKIFAVDAINGGNWSRMVGRVVKVAFRKVTEGKKSKTVTIPLADSMRNTPLDIFTIQAAPKSSDIDIQMETKSSMASVLDAAVKVQPGKTAYLLVIDPKTTNCIYNKI